MTASRCPGSPIGSGWNRRGMRQGMNARRPRGRPFVGTRPPRERCALGIALAGRAGVQAVGCSGRAHDPVLGVESRARPCSWRCTARAVPGGDRRHGQLTADYTSHPARGRKGQALAKICSPLSNACFSAASLGSVRQPQRWVMTHSGASSWPSRSLARSIASLRDLPPTAVAADQTMFGHGRPYTRAQRDSYLQTASNCGRVMTSCASKMPNGVADSEGSLAPLT